MRRIINMGNNKNILDEPIKEINVPILKPTKYSTNNRILANMIIKVKSEVSKFADWIYSHKFQNHKRRKLMIVMRI